MDIVPHVSHPKGVPPEFQLMQIPQEVMPHACWRLLLMHHCCMGTTEARKRSSQVVKRAVHGPWAVHTLHFGRALAHVSCTPSQLRGFANLELREDRHRVLPDSGLELQQWIFIS